MKGGVTRLRLLIVDRSDLDVIVVVRVDALRDILIGAFLDMRKEGLVCLELGLPPTIPDTLVSCYQILCLVIDRRSLLQLCLLNIAVVSHSRSLYCC